MATAAETEAKKAPSGEKKMSGEKSTTELYRWVAGTAIGLVMFLLGGFVTSVINQSALYEHTSLGGHPVMEERVQSLENLYGVQLKRIQEDLRDIKTELRALQR